MTGPELSPTTGPTLTLLPTGGLLTLTVDPSLLSAAGRPMHVVAAELRSASAALRLAWDAAARALAGQRTGQALASCPGFLAALLGGADSLDGFGAALQRAADVYRDADAKAVSASATPQ
jgi:hypothetical protein